jgi:predicted RNA-binding protein with RPS1 domain
MPIELGSVQEGVVTGITNFGAFIELPGGVTGLVHISEIAGHDSIFVLGQIQRRSQKLHLFFG